jgi:hypothetical protein
VLSAADATSDAPRRTRTCRADSSLLWRCCWLCSSICSGQRGAQPNRLGVRVEASIWSAHGVRVVVVLMGRGRVRVSQCGVLDAGTRLERTALVMPGCSQRRPHITGCTPLTLLVHPRATSGALTNNTTPLQQSQQHLTTLPADLPTPVKRERQFVASRAFSLAAVNTGSFIAMHQTRQVFMGHWRPGLKEWRATYDSSNSRARTGVASGAGAKTAKSSSPDAAPRVRFYVEEPLMALPDSIACMFLPLSCQGTARVCALCRASALRLAGHNEPPCCCGVQQHAHHTLVRSFCTHHTQSTG